MTNIFDEIAAIAADKAKLFHPAAKYLMATRGELQVENEKLRAAILALHVRVYALERKAELAGRKKK